MQAGKNGIGTISNIAIMIKDLLFKVALMTNTSGINLQKQ